MAERLDLTVPETTPAITTYAVTYLCLDWSNARITVEFTGTNGEKKAHSWEGATATTLMVALNKANLTANSLQRRVLAKVTADGVLAGTVSGTPD